LNPLQRLYRWNIVLDTIIKHFNGIPPTAGLAAELHAAIDRDYKYRDFDVVSDHWMLNRGSSVEPFRPIPGMAGYTDDMNKLQGLDAINKVRTS
jgi:hypothetical protein